MILPTSPSQNDRKEDVNRDELFVMFKTCSHHYIMVLSRLRMNWDPALFNNWLEEITN